MRGSHVIAFRTGIAIPFIAFSLCLGACQSSAPVPLGKGVETQGLAKLLEKNPVDVAVAPIQNAAGRDVPASVLRACFQQELVSRRYSPLALDFVDRNVVDASYTPGASNEQAVMLIEIERWDTSLFKTHNAISTRMQVRMLDAQSGEELWTGRVDGRYDFGSALGNLPTESARVQHACKTIAAEILEKLPARDPLIRS